MFGIPGKQVNHHRQSRDPDRKALYKEGNQGLHRRQKGGCAGMEYTMDVADVDPLTGRGTRRRGTQMIAPMAQMFLFGKSTTGVAGNRFQIPQSKRHRSLRLWVESIKFDENLGA
jgi:hypothetical protein